MSIQQSINSALQAGVIATGVGKGLSNQKQMMQQQAEANAKKIQQQAEANATQLNILKEMQKKANQNLKMTREAMKEQRTQFNMKTSGAAQTVSDPRKFAETFKTEANKVNKTRNDYNKALQERKDIKSQIKGLEDK